jgi:hypothetical protein
MTDVCTHFAGLPAVKPSAGGCEDCLREGSRWLHLRMCMHCGHVGCCDSSPKRHARAHWNRLNAHTVIRSFEPDENWWWCFTDDLLFDVPGSTPAPSHS